MKRIYLVRDEDRMVYGCFEEPTLAEEYRIKKKAIEVKEFDVNCKPDYTNGEYFKNLEKYYFDGKWLEMNVVELMNQAGGMNYLFRWLYRSGIRFLFKPNWYWVQNETKKRGAGTDMIVMSKNLEG